MAREPYTGVPTTEPQSGGAPYQHIDTPRFTADMFGGQVGQALTDMGRGALHAATFFGEVAADNASNEYAEQINKIMYGDPTKKTLGPDGQPQQDTGFMGLKGRAALDARPDLDKRMEEVRKQMLGKMLTPQQQLRFNDFSRKHKTWAADRMDQHADTQANLWYDQVENAKAANAQRHIANNANDPAQVIDGREQLRSAYVAKAQRAGGGPDLINAAVNRADREAVEAQAMAVSVTDPQRARRIIESNKDALGLHYDEMANRVRTRAETADGRDWADGKLTGGDYDNNVSNITRSNFNYSGGKGAPHGNFETFQTAEHGVAAAYQTMQAKAKANGGQINFVDLIGGNKRVQGWAAKDDNKDPMLKGNDPQAYAKVLADSVGMKPGDNLPLGDADKMSAILKAQNKLEKGRQTVPDDSFKNGIVLASGGALQRAPQQAPRSQNDLIQEALDDPYLNDHPHAQAAAIARINQSYRLQNAKETKTKAAFDQVEKDTVAAVQKTGDLLPNAPTELDYVRHYGPENGAARYAEFQEKVKAGQAWHSLQDMPDAEQRAYISDRATKLDPAAPGFAAAQKLQENLEKMVDHIQKTRREDPGQAVARNPAVLEAQSRVDPKDHDSVRTLGQVRMQAQEQLGIEGDSRTPITKAEALKIMNPVVMALPGQKPDALEKVAADLRKVYGDEMAAQAFVYGMRAIHAQGTFAETAGGILNDLAAGKPLTTQDRQAAKEAADAKAIQAALEAKQPGPLPSWIEDPGAAAAATMPAKPPGKVTVPTDQALRMLRDNPSTAKEFDEVYGPGKSKEVMEQYPWYFQKRGAGGR